jgi:hypothetical protein
MRRSLRVSNALPMGESLVLIKYAAPVGAVPMIQQLAF